MKVLAHRMTSPIFIYGFLTLLGISILLVASGEMQAGMITGGALITVFSGYIFIRGLLVPKDIISIDENGMLILHFCNKTISPDELTDISYRDYSRYAVYPGRLEITTEKDVYKCSFVADVEKVSKELTRLMHESRKAPSYTQETR